MKKKSVYRRKLTRALRSTFKEYDSLPSYTAEEACYRISNFNYPIIDSRGPGGVAAAGRPPRPRPSFARRVV